MKKNIFYLLLFLFPQIGFSQFLTPKHATKIYFTDAKGNSDTLLFGLTPNTDPTGWDVLYGELNMIDKAFDATLDARFLYGSGNVKRSIKNSKGDCDGPSYLLKQERFIIGFHAKHLPVTMRWDPKFLQEICVPYQYITREHWIDALSENTTIRMHQQDSLLISRAYLDTKVGNSIQEQYFITPTNEGKLDTVFLFYMTYSKEKDLVASKEVEENASLQLSPNPVSNDLTVTFSDAWLENQAWTVAKIIGIDGTTYSKKELERNSKNTTLSTENLPSGLYFLNIERSDRRSVNKKFIKE